MKAYILSLFVIASLGSTGHAQFEENWRTKDYGSTANNWIDMEARQAMALLNDGWPATVCGNNSEGIDPTTSLRVIFSRLKELGAKSVKASAPAIYESLVICVTLSQ